MDVINAIINSVPEPLATAILTAAFTGVIVFLFQKRIENSFARKLEDYKADLQKSAAEHQIKFSRNLPKALDVLEAYHKKLADCAQFCHQLSFFILRALQGKQLEEAEMQEKRNIFFRLLLDLGEYSANNRLYLPDEINQELAKIKDRAHILAIASMNLFERVGEPIDAIIEHIDLWSKLADISTSIPIEVQESLPNVSFVEFSKRIEEAMPKESKVSRFTGQIDEEFTRLSRQVEALYKSIAEAQ